MQADKDRLKAVVEATRADRERVRQLVDSRRWREAEPDRARMAVFTAKTQRRTLPSGAAEAIVGTDDLQASWFLPAGAAIRRAVGYVEANNAGIWSVGSGFLISRDLFLTNQHVVADALAAAATQVTFDREAGDDGTMRSTTTFALDPDRFAIFSRQEEFDYALIGIGNKLGGPAELDELGCCVLSNRPDRHVIGMSVNIIQHPNGLPKMIGVRNNVLQFRTDRTLLYETDTEHGSSGSPVFNDSWELIALHHFGEPYLERTDENGQPIPVNVNEGVRISAIFDDLASKSAGLPEAQRGLLQAALDLSKRVVARPGGKTLSPPRPSEHGQEGLQISKETTAMSGETPVNEIKVVIPVEVTVRVGQSTGAKVHAAPPEPVKKLTSGAEKLAIDRDYSNRDGYNPHFVKGIEFPLPEAVGKTAKQVAPLRAGEENAAAGELKYQHFSIKLNKSKKMALFTATNIDGKAYLDIDRKTGLVKEAAEGETWYTDPRSSETFYLGQPFYSAWSNLFDRGHLTRRMDPNWGSVEEAQRANADTYHLTNCTPQHFRFNESTEFWQGAEQYVLENGAIAEDTENKICAFQGPIFNDKIDLWSDDVQIPSSFFKVIAWKGRSGVKSVGLVVDQLTLLSEQRHGGIKPGPAAFVNVSQWRVAITDIERRTGLDFGNTIRDADTFQDAGQPVVGEAAKAIPVRSKADLLPKQR